MAIDMSQFYQVFYEESAEHLQAMESLLLALDIANPDAEDLNAIFRAAHSIKGSAGTFGFNDLAGVTHILENLLDRIRKRELALRPDMVDAFLASSDLLRAMLEAHQGRGTAVDPAEVEQLCRRLQSLSAGGQSPSPALPDASLPDEAPIRCLSIEFLPTEASARSGGVANFISGLAGLGALNIETRPPEDGVAGFWKLRLQTRHQTDDLAEQLDFLAERDAWRLADEPQPSAAEAEDFGFFADAPGAPAEDPGYGFFAPLPAAPVATEASEGYGFFAPLPAKSEPPAEDGYGFFVPLPAAAVAVEMPVLAPAPAATPVEARAKVKTSASADSSIRVGVEKVDQLINLVGELVITQAMLLQTAASMQEQAPERLVSGLTQLERNTRDLQEAVLSIRMLPISAVFSRFPRVVRDLAGKLGKRVELKTVGESTELDKGLIERIADPLTHLIRNSMDHGIETEARRQAAGKSPVGTITLKAYHQGGSIVIEVGDDGAGLNRDKILAKARERGLPVSEQMSDQEVFALIFEAGFSTADQITDVSGRGVGMDVVRRNIQEMGGRVEIESMLGIGTRTTVRLPLTLAILDGMSVAVGGQTYILPLAAVIESLQPLPSDVKTLANQGRVIQVRGEYLPVVALHEIFGLKPQAADFTQGIMIILDADGSKAALFVDALVGQHQVVIKSLEANYKRVPGVSGATIMGDGQVALILDVSAIAALARTRVPPPG